MAKGNTTHCPVCNNFGSPKLSGYCKKCYEESGRQKCMIHGCEEEAVMFGDRVARYCKEHLYGEQYDLRRKTFNTKAGDAVKGWRQEDPKEFDIIREDFPARR